jgi:hypothetical protein
MAFIERNGFRARKSTEIALQNFIESTQEATEKKMKLTGIFLDLTKSYEVLNHKVLLSKLNSYGIRGAANLRFESYLSHWKRVEINNMKKGIYASTTKEIERGVPQGSILGPIPFSIYINDLPLNIMGTKIVLFADNTNNYYQMKI